MLVPHFAAVPFLVAASDLVAVVPLGLVRLFGHLNLQGLTPPLEIAPFHTTMIWHERYQNDLAHAWLRDRTLATWVARNVLVQFQVENAWPDVGERKGTQEMGRREWRWLARVSQTDEAQLRRLDVEVFLLDAEEEEPVSVLSGFLQQPAS